MPTCTWTRGHIMVCPSLQEWIGEELRKDNLVLKERCKAREERLAKPAPLGKKHWSPTSLALLSLRFLGLWHWDRCLAHGFLCAPGGPHPVGGQDSFDSGKLLSMGPPRRARELLPLHLGSWKGLPRRVASTTATRSCNVLGHSRCQRDK